MDLDTLDGCELVTTIRPQPKGYIRVTVGGKGIMAHRLVMEMFLGRPLDPDETIDHTCHNLAYAEGRCQGGTSCPHRRCINVEHLEVCDAVENWSRGSLGVQKMRREKTHCPHGHPYEEGNLRASKSGYRACRACHRARQSGRPLDLEPTYLP